MKDVLRNIWLDVTCDWTGRVGSEEMSACALMLFKNVPARSARGGQRRAVDSCPCAAGWLRWPRAAAFVHWWESGTFSVSANDLSYLTRPIAWDSNVPRDTCSVGGQVVRPL